MSNICNTLKQLEAMCIKIGEMVKLPLNIKIKQYNFQDSVFVCIGTSLKAEIIEMLSFSFSHWRKNHPKRQDWTNRRRGNAIYTRVTYLNSLFGVGTQ